jgi:hypothetical protein
MVKKILLMFVIFLVSFSFAFAENGSTNGSNSNTPEVNTTDDSPQIGTLRPVSRGKYMREDGREMNIEQVRNRNRLRVGNHSANCSLELQQEQSLTGTKLKATLSNGRNAEIKIMPDVAAERALERLRLRVCLEEEGCEIELKEVGKGNETKPAYEIHAGKEARVLGMFKTRMRVQAQVDAENGEVIRVQKPWWAFLASETKE